MKLRIAAETLNSYAHLDAYRDLPNIVEKIQNSLQRWKSEKPTHRAIYFDTPPRYEGIANLSFFFKAIEESRQVSFLYHSFHAGHPKVVLLDPYFLRQHAHRWYVGGHSHDPTEGFIRTYPLERIVGTPEQKGFSYTKPQDYDPESYWRDIFGISRPPNGVVEVVVVEFDSLQGKYFLTRPFFEPFEVLEDCPQRLVVRFNIIVNHELVAEIAKLGAHAKILEPPNLAIKVRDFFYDAYCRYT
jgi:predicted DNA-binding transcriptional regulator YafY